LEVVAEAVLLVLIVVLDNLEVLVAEVALVKAEEVTQSVKEILVVKVVLHRQEFLMVIEAVAEVALAVQDLTVSKEMQTEEVVYKTVLMEHLITGQVAAEVLFIKTEELEMAESAEAAVEDIEMLEAAILLVLVEAVH
jgi:hypothetical protein